MIIVDTFDGQASELDLNSLDELTLSQLVEAGYDGAAEELESRLTVTASGQFHLPGQHDQRKHGRRKHLAPGAPPQVAEPQGFDADRVALWHRDLRDLGDLIASLGSGEKKREPLSGGVNGDVALVWTEAGTKVVEKTMDRDKAADNVGEVLGDPVRQADSEQMFSAMGRAFGARVPRAVRDQPDRVWLDYVEGLSTGADLSGELFDHVVKTDPDTPEGARQRQLEFGDWQRQWQSFVVGLALTDDGELLGLMDLLGFNWDRGNDTNWGVDENDKIAGVDHSFGWSTSTYASHSEADFKIVADRPPPRDQLSPFSVAFVKPDPNDPSKLVWRDNDLSPEDVAFFRRQLDDLKDDFAVLERGDWWKLTSARLDAIAAHATGTETRYAP